MELLARYIDARLAAMLVGGPGIGKTDIVIAAAKKAGAELLIMHPVTADPTDFRGLPFRAADNKSADFLPFGDLKQLCDAKKPLVCFLDDLGQAPPSVQAAAMQLILARTLNGHKLSKFVTFIAATNRRSDRAGVAGILEPVKSRFAGIFELEANLNDWKTWAYANDIPAELVAFLNFKSNLLAEAWKPTQDIVAQPCPRTWAFVGQKILPMGLSGVLESDALTGAVGGAAAGELKAFLRMYRDLPDLDELLANVDGAAIPDDPATLYAICTSLAMRADVNNFAQIARYAERLADDTKGEHAVLMMRDSVRRDRTLYETKAFTKMTTTSVGRLFRGEEN
jgi:hypothetical protein